MKDGGASADTPAAAPGQVTNSTTAAAEKTTIDVEAKSRS